MKTKKMGLLVWVLAGIALGGALGALMFRDYERTSQELRANVPCRKHKENMCDCVRHLFRNWKC